MKLFLPIIRISLFLFISLFQKIFCQIPGEAGDCERVLHLSCQRSCLQLWSEGLWCPSWWAPEARCVKPQVLEEQCRVPSGCTTLDQLWTLHQVLNDSWGFGQPVHVLYGFREGIWRGRPLSQVVFKISMDRISRRSQGPAGVRLGTHMIGVAAFLQMKWSCSPQWARRSNVPLGRVQKNVKRLG